MRPCGDEAPVSSGGRSIDSVRTSWAEWIPARRTLKRSAKARQSWLNDYCLFRLLMDREDGSQVWQQWPKEYQDRDSALAMIVEEAKTRPEEIDRELRYYAYVQWIAFEQWKEVSPSTLPRKASP